MEHQIQWTRPKTQSAITSMCGLRWASPTPLKMSFTAVSRSAELDTAEGGWRLGYWLMPERGREFKNTSECSLGNYTLSRTRHCPRSYLGHQMDWWYNRERYRFSKEPLQMSGNKQIYRTRQQYGPWEVGLCWQELISLDNPNIFLATLVSMPNGSLQPYCTSFQLRIAT